MYSSNCKPSCFFFFGSKFLVSLFWSLSFGGIKKAWSNPEGAAQGLNPKLLAVVRCRVQGAVLLVFVCRLPFFSCAP